METTQIKQLALSLENNSTSGERLSALEDLQHIAKKQNMAALVGVHALSTILHFLSQQQATVEEYQEALDLIYRLVKSREGDTAASNASIILSDASYIELLLDLLDHEDLTVGVMASQILTEIHSQDGTTLEAQIQKCPDGMNKLLQRLPDVSREEVRNQAIVLIQQLTSTNEEMKKTVVFNEGFEILFGIIRSEGGATDAGLVIQDCLQICTNILHDSETCQRLFFGMGVEWILKLSEFFDPTLLESTSLARTDGLIDDGESSSFSSQSSSSLWFDQPTRLSSAILAINALNNSLSTVNKKHQSLLMDSATTVVASSAFWIARKGPVELVNAALSLLYRIANENPRVSVQLTEFVIKVPAARQGQNIPFGVDVPLLNFGWKVGGKQLISIASLLAERYIYSMNSGCWDSAAASAIKDSLNVDFDVLSILLRDDPDSFANGCLYVLEKILSTDSSASDLMVQFALAPPPPPPIDGDDSFDFGNGSEEASQPVGTVTSLLNLIVEGGRKILNSNQFSAVTVNAFRVDLELAERAANVLTVFFTHGSQLARDISTAIKANYGDTAGGNGRLKSAGGDSEVKLLLPFLILAAGRTTRMQQGSGYPLLISILRLLATVVCGCERAAKLVLDDPSNLFVLDLATPASESAGVPPIAQTASCLFLGCCFLALQDESSPGESKAGAKSDSEASLINKKLFISMIDSRIGLSRFTELLKRPLLAQQAASFAPLFVSDGFRAFYSRQFEAIKNGIISFYAGGSSSLAGSPQQQVIDMQQAKIEELEKALLAAEKKAVKTSDGSEHALSGEQAVEFARLKAAVESKSKELSAKAEIEDTLKQELSRLQALYGDAEKAQKELILQRQTLQATIADMSNKLEISAMKIRQLETDTEIITSECSNAKMEAVKLENSLKRAEYKISDLMNELESAKINSLGAVDERSLQLEGQVKGLQALLQKEREEKLSISQKADRLESELTSLQSKHMENRIVHNDQMVEELKAQIARLVQDSEKSNKEAAREILETKKWAAQTAAKSESYMLVLVDAVLNFEQSFSSAVGGDLFSALKKESQNGSDLENALTLAADILNRCNDVFNAAVGECSDLAEGAQIHNLDGKEGSVERILDCNRKLRIKLTEAIEDYEAELEALENAKEEAEKEALELREELDSLTYKQANDELISKLSDDDRATLSIKCDELEKGIAEAKAESAGLSDQISLLQQAYDRALEEKGNLGETVKQLRNEQANTQKHNANEINKMLDQINTSRVDLQAALERVAAEEAKVLVYEQKDRDQRKSISDLTAELESNKRVSEAAQQKHAAELQLLTAEMSKLQEVVVALKESKNAGDQKISQLEERNNKLENDLALSKQQLASTEQKLDLLRLQQSSVGGGNDNSIDVLQKTITEIKLEKQLLESQIQDAAKRLESNEKELEKANEYSSSLLIDAKSANSQLCDARSEIERLTNQITTNSDAHAALSAANSQLEKLILTLKNEKLSVETLFAEEKKQLVEKVTALELQLCEALSAATASQSTVEEQIQRLETELAAVLLEKSGQSEKVAALQSEIDLILSARDQAVSALRTFEEELETTRSELAKATAEKLSAEANAAEEHANYVKSAESLEEAKKSIASLEQLILSSQAKISESAAELSTRNTENQELIKRISELELEVASSERSRSRLENDIKQLTHIANEESSQLTEKVKNLEQQLDVGNRERDKLQSELAELTAKLAEAANSNAALEERIHVVEKQTEQLEVKEAENQVSFAAAIGERDKEIQDLSLSQLQLQVALESERSKVQSLTDFIETQKTQLEQLSEELEAQKKSIAQYQLSAEDYGKQLSALQSEVRSQEDELAARSSQIQSLTDSLAKSEDDLKNVKVQLEAKKAKDLNGSRVSYSSGLSKGSYNKENAPDLDAFKARDNELKRLTMTTDRLAKELGIKEEALNSAVAMLKRREGEAAGVMASLEGLRAEVAELRGENDLLSKRNTTDGKKLKDLTEELESLRAALRTESEEKTALAEQLKAEKSKLEAVNATKLQQGNSSAGNSAIKVRSSSSEEKSLQTPEATKWKSAQAAIAVSISPAAREAAKLNSEIIKERKRLHALQEQHSDLLGLLAQQEVELSVFRAALGTRLGTEVVETVEQEAERSVVDLYGSYTNFRKYSLENANSLGGTV